MDDIVALFLMGQKEFGARLGEISDSQWGDPTIDDDWNVGALVDHLIDEARWFGPLVSGQSLADATKAVEGMGSPEADRHGAWAAASSSAAEALQTAPLDGEVELSRGMTPTIAYITEMTFDLCVHSWDLGKAIGSQRTLPDELVEPVYTIVQQFGDLTAFGDMFKPAVPVSDDAPTVDKLMALTGRDPN